jgi:hypothetical protein
MTATAFVDPGGNYTKLFCFGDDYRTRWCYGMNVCLGVHGFEFLLPYSATFEPVFLVPGARAPPFDPSEYRVKGSMIRTSRQTKRAFVDVTGFFGSRFYNTRMLWHNVMDSLFPTYWTMTTYASQRFGSEWGETGDGYGRIINHTNEILVYDDAGAVALFYLKALSENPIQQFWERWPAKCYRRIVLGLRKSERVAMDVHNERDGLLLRYEIDPDGISGMRKEMLEFAGTSVEKCEPSIERPLVLIIERKTKQQIRKILNPEDFIQATQDLCPGCEVRTVDLQEFDKLGQVRFTCNASVLIGVHGSGLIHAGWMRRSADRTPTSIIELLPFHYTCRDWYHQYARMLGMEYIAVYTLNQNQSRWEPWHNASKVERCQTLPDECFRIRCHDFLRDQSIIVDIEYYKSVAGPFFERLNQARGR